MTILDVHTMLLNKDVRRVLAINLSSIIDSGFEDLIIQLLRHGTDFGMHNKQGVSFYSLFKLYTRENSGSARLDKIQEVLQVPSLQSLCIHSAYLLRDKIACLSGVPKLIKEYLNIT